MSEILIQQYYSKVDKIIQYSGSRQENALRSAFEFLINGYCESKNLLLVNELELKTRFGTTVRPDGTIKDALRLDWGYWESKDQFDDLDAEIKDKFAKGYPDSNILFEDSRRAVLFQNGARIMDANVRNVAQLDEIITRLLSYERPEIRTFREAIEQFRQDLPMILETLRNKIAAESRTNAVFQTARQGFLSLCQEAIHPQITPEDVREMMIQHILTEDIFLSVFNESQFHRDNNIARELQKIVETFFTGYIRKNILAGIQNYYLAIRSAAANIVNHHEKQRFLKILYENFYRAYNPKAADRLGIFYTPNEIVRFMIESADALLYRVFGKMLRDKGVEILDPATGTGTFIAELIDYLPKAELADKYQHEIHCNEVSILPYYIANLNIEFTYKQKMGEYAEFRNICFMDTLDHAEFTHKQSDIFAMSVENTERIQRQNEREIFVIIGNPPYNANQMNENDNNKNREYEKIDERIKLTYIKQSTAQKTKLYDMYARFFRWAWDRIGEKEGMAAFVTNSSFIDARTFDGFRKVAAEEFDEIYVVDLGGNVRKKEKSNVFGIKLGVAVSFMIKYRNRRDSLHKKHKRNMDESVRCRIFYYHVPDFETAKEKLNFLASVKFADIDFRHVVPDKDHNWINITDNDFDSLIPLANKETILTKSEKNEIAIFKLYTGGIKTNRDEWVYDFDKKNLKDKIRFFIDVYNAEIDKLSAYKTIPEINNRIDYSIKWSRDLKNELLKGRKVEYSKKKIIRSLYRPFCRKYFYSEFILNDVLTHNHYEIFGNNLINKAENVAIGVMRQATEKDFCLLATNVISDYNSLSPASGGNLCLPLFRFDDNGTRIDNITDWGLKQFQTRYKDKKIIKTDIFHYVYAVLHHPAYRDAYEQNLKRELPRIPFYKDFLQWKTWGETLMNLHIHYETVEPYPLERIDTPEPSPKPKLKADTEKGIIHIDTATSLHGVPKTAWEYRLGTYSALQWVLEQYKEKKVRDPTVAEKFNTYRFADYKEEVITLLQKVCTVSIKTMEIVRKM